ncbi:hypothetical protein [Streptomyces avermitilis]
MLAAAAVAAEASHWSLYVDRHRFDLSPKACPRFAHRHGVGG